LPASFFEPGSPAKGYRGRFAPSPTGPLHFGSLVAAVASYAQALAQNGEWLVRIEDTDPSREIAGAAGAILASLDAHGFYYPEPLYQSTRLEYYDAQIELLVESGAAYPCSCTRKMLLASADRGCAGLIYPGNCRKGADTSKRPATAIRLLTDNQHPVEFTDAIQGHQSCRMEAEIGDFLLRRGDGYVAYQIAVALDDSGQDITEVVRGTDLLESTFMQLLLMRKLGLKSPKYAHFPVVTDSDGKKLSKQSGAQEIDNKSPKLNILKALSFLLQEPPQSLKSASLEAIWAWVAENWNIAPLTEIRGRSERSIMKW